MTLHRRCHRVVFFLQNQINPVCHKVIIHPAYLYAEGFIVFAFSVHPFVRSFDRTFVCKFVFPSHSWILGSKVLPQSL